MVLEALWYGHPSLSWSWVFIGIEQALENLHPEPTKLQEKQFCQEETFLKDRNLIWGGSGSEFCST